MTSHPEAFPKPVLSFPSFCIFSGGETKKIRKGWQGYAAILISWFRVNSRLLSLYPTALS